MTTIVASAATAADTSVVQCCTEAGAAIMSAIAVLLTAVMCCEKLGAVTVCPVVLYQEY